MGETILLIAVLLLALYGCVELIRGVVTRWLAPQSGEAGIWVIPVSGHRSDIEYVVRLGGRWSAAGRKNERSGVSGCWIWGWTGKPDSLQKSSVRRPTEWGCAGRPN